MNTTREEKKRLERKLIKKMLASIPLALYNKMTGSLDHYAKPVVIIKDNKYNLSSEEIGSAIDVFIRWFSMYRMRPAKVEIKTKRTILKKTQMRIITFYI